MRDVEYAFIRELVYEHSRINLGNEKRELVSARLGRRLRATKIPSISDYCSFLQSNEGKRELPHLIDAISTNHTHFFREQPHFEFLRSTVIPEFLRTGSPIHGKELSIWSAASSSGEEPFSIAISLAEQGLPPPTTWRIEASDISYRILDRAKKAIYPASALQSISPPLVKKYFDKGMAMHEGHYRVIHSLRQRVQYHRINLLTDAYPFKEPFTVIFCRNVMIYFDRQTQTELVQRLHQCIRPGGYLFVGHSESLAGVQHAFEYVRPAIYRRKP